MCGVGLLNFWPRTQLLQYYSSTSTATPLVGCNVSQCNALQCIRVAPVLLLFLYWLDAMFLNAMHYNAIELL